RRIFLLKGGTCYSNPHMQKNILIIGQPKSGKSTLLDKVISDIPKKVGFITKEIRANGQRTGFEIQTHLGNKAMLASVDFKTPHQVSKYFVSVENLDLVIPEISRFTDKDVLYLDEIGQMELFSEKFKELVLKFLDSQNTFLATISQVYENDFTKAIKNRKDIISVELSEENREAKEKFLGLLVKKIERARGYISEPDRIIRKNSGAEIRSEHGKRNLIRLNGGWECNCDFFKINKICSHSIAAAEVIR
ncbi:MAG: nucleoside-triphosphatase, partial [Patescibacteria group bacterium]